MICVAVSRSLLDGVVRGLGYDVVVAPDGHAAWAALTGPAAPRLAILDWQMPGVDGLEVCRRLRADPATATTYVLLLTGKGLLPTAQAGIGYSVFAVAMTIGRLTGDAVVAAW